MEVRRDWPSPLAGALLLLGGCYWVGNGMLLLEAASW